MVARNVVLRWTTDLAKPASVQLPQLYAPPQLRVDISRPDPARFGKLSTETLAGEFTPSSQDPVLHKLAADEACSLVTSTSAVSKTFFQCIRAILQLQGPLGTDCKYASVLRSPAVTVMTPVVPRVLDALDAAPVPAQLIFGRRTTMQLKVADQLQRLGQTIEKLATSDSIAFATTAAEVAPAPTAFRFKKVGNVLLRSQLDALDPNTKEPIEIKARGLRAYRLFAGGFSHRLETQQPNWAKETEDLLRGQIPLYAVQLRIGTQQGVLVLHHNTDRILRCRYLRAEEVDALAYGSELNARVGFEFSAWLLSNLQNIIRRVVPSDVPVVIRTLAGRRALHISFRVWRGDLKNELERALHHRLFFEEPGGFHLAVTTSPQVNGCAQYHPFLLGETDNFEVVCDFTLSRC
eukprot:TRINITY_DN21044_c0_g1_i1.p1 TRINITY_DN21044_c0_g1~~TRINITY_DN21044_c0_g1_i1.p1  ORF type:complete len:434 (+),score=47.18 TRINITY_DN21044_c0_g1_i1:83-1303(+)